MGGPPSEAEAAPVLPPERVAVVTFLLARGHAFTTQEAALLARVTPAAAVDLLTRLCRVLPLAAPSPENGGRWLVLPEDEDGGWLGKDRTQRDE